MVSPLPKDIQSVLVTTSAKSISISISLYKSDTRKITETTALVDGGAMNCFIDLYLAYWMRWSLTKLHHPIIAQNANWTKNLGGLIQYQIVLSLWVQDWLESQIFYVLNFKDNVILGYSWLVKNNPKVNWAKGEIAMTGKTSLQHDHPDTLRQTYLLAYLGVSPDHNIWYLASVQKKQKMGEFTWKVLKDNPESIWRLTLSPSLAQATRTKEMLLPPQCKDYTKVFDEPTARVLPP